MLRASVRIAVWMIKHRSRRLGVSLQINSSSQRRLHFCSSINIHTFSQFCRAKAIMAKLALADRALDLYMHTFAYLWVLMRSLFAALSVAAIIIRALARTIPRQKKGGNKTAWCQWTYGAPAMDCRHMALGQIRRPASRLAPRHSDWPFAKPPGVAAPLWLDKFEVSRHN